ncbi:hypothetical protein MFLO_05745 [Listeria floridensis FSL S10-1187]|uniref:UPF0637 protein MFLO_05745 n=1 Tax=Listeria floridensis FSL S10-1187 TaxID=1265817 RepID=A0ABP3B1E2_9LIST|nr:DUF1054 domain-containing protein [Listeria floridensis]EUJ33072.1 hypothetical protein MFLO_05745 [Listeria floridensis FSL S10-1187]
MTDAFSKKDFKAMRTPGLEERMEAIQTEIQPKFKSFGETLTSFLSLRLGTEMFLHIARHARRSVNPPDSTWFAIANDKRGYKKHPHFQVGLYGDYVFVWLAFIYENTDRTKIAERFLKNQRIFLDMTGFSISKDHMVPTTYPLEQEVLESALTRFRDVKKGEFLVGKIYHENDPILKSSDSFLVEVESVFDELLPLYLLSLK